MLHKTLSEEYVRVPDGRYTSGGKCSGKPVHSSEEEAAARAARKFGRVPATVISDPTLKYRDKAVYVALALFERKGIVNTGIRYMAKACHIRPEAFCLGIAALVKGGHISTNQSAKRGQRQSYQLVSTVFTGKVKEEKRLAQGETVLASHTCPKCERPARLNKVGMCYGCADELKWTRAKSEMGGSPTREEVAQFLHLKQLTRRWEQVARRAERAA